MAPNAYGIDISNHQTLFDAKAVYNNGIRFAYLKATEGTSFRDLTMNGFAIALRAAGIKVGVYHFISQGDPVAQARFFQSWAGHLMGPGFLPPVLDIEDSYTSQGARIPCPKEDSWHNAFFDTIRMPMLAYGSLSEFASKNINPDGWGRRPVRSWVAVYNGDPGNMSPLPSRTVLHQHSESGNVPGLSAGIDRNATVGTTTLASLMGSTDSLTVSTPAPAPAPKKDEVIDNMDMKTFLDTPVSGLADSGNVAAKTTRSWTIRQLLQSAADNMAGAAGKQYDGSVVKMNRQTGANVAALSAKVDALSAQVSKLSTGNIDTDALANSIASHLNAGSSPEAIAADVVKAFGSKLGS